MRTRSLSLRWLVEPMLPAARGGSQDALSSANADQGGALADARRRLFHVETSDLRRAGITPGYQGPIPDAALSVDG